MGLEISSFFSRDCQILKNKRDFLPRVSDGILTTVLSVIQPDRHKITNIFHKKVCLIKLSEPCVIRDHDKTIMVDNFVKSDENRNLRFSDT